MVTGSWLFGISQNLLFGKKFEDPRTFRLAGSLTTGWWVLACGIGVKITTELKTTLSISGISPPGSSPVFAFPER